MKELTGSYGIGQLGLHLLHEVGASGQRLSFPDFTALDLFADQDGDHHGRRQSVDIRSVISRF